MTNPHLTQSRPIPARVDAVIFDVDGCLSPEFNEPMDLLSLHRIREICSADGAPPIGLCTGRPVPYVDAMTRVVGALEIPSVCEGGVWVLDPEAYSWSMDPRIGPEHLAAIAECRAWIDKTFEGVFFEAGKTASITTFHPDGPEHLKANLWDRLDREIESRGWALRTSMTWSCLNTELAFVNKATGLDRLLKVTGLKPEHLVGVGDTMSDLPLRDRVAWFACPANATDEIKQHADYVAKASEAEGAVEILGMLSG